MFSKSIKAFNNTNLLNNIKHLNPALTQLSGVLIDYAKGSWIYTTKGEEYLDFTCGIGVTNTGHCHQKIVKAAQDQISKIIHAQMNIYYHKPLLQLTEKLATVVNSYLDTYFFCNSGAEAVENAIKLARTSTGKQNIIAFKGSFHGRTFGTMALTHSKTMYRVGFGPLMPGVHSTPFPYTYHSKMNEEECSKEAIHQLELLLKTESDPSETAAVLIEPILGEGGYVVAPKKFMKELRNVCDKNGLLLIFDEVQSGFGRTGKFWAFEHVDVLPDILIMAKGIASGFPLSAIVANKKLFANAVLGSYGGTYGGNAVACAAACATIDVILEEKLMENANERGHQLKKGLESLKKKYPIGDVRGRGLMIGVEFDPSVEKGTVNKITKECVNNKLLLLSTSIFETLRFIPPLNVTKEEIEIGLEKFEKSLKNVFG